MLKRSGRQEQIIVTKPVLINDASACRRHANGKQPLLPTPKRSRAEKPAVASISMFRMNLSQNRTPLQS
jgi:hypothetical protein